MRQLCKNIFWLLSGGLNETFRQRDRLKEELRQSRDLLDRILTGRPVPFIMLNTLPKSGSAYLVESLRLGLGIAGLPISSGYFPLDVIDMHKIAQAATGRSIAQEHFDANAINLQMLQEFSPRVVIHLREPRQALLSWIHQMIRNMNLGHRSTLLCVAPQPPAALFEKDLASIIDWHIVHHFPNMLKWMDEWLAHAESGELPRVKFTSFEEFRKNPERVISSILEYYEIPPSWYLPQEVPKSDATHFRKGLVEEWREVFSPHQQLMAAQMMERFPRVAALYPPGEVPAEGAAPARVAGSAG